MKKIIIAALAVGLVLVAYLAQVAYMGKLNQQFFEQNIKPNDFVSFENVKFEKGFFTSKASFEGRIKAEAYQLASSATRVRVVSKRIQSKLATRVAKTNTTPPIVGVSLLL